MVTLIDLPPGACGGRVRFKYEKAIRERFGINPAMIADELGIKESTVIMIQRKLGLRACRPSKSTRIKE